MKRCIACGAETPNRLCHFCQRTVDLVKADRCVSCTGPVARVGYARVEARCGNCYGVSLSEGTREVLRLASKARAKQRARVRAAA